MKWAICRNKQTARWKGKSSLFCFHFFGFFCLFRRVVFLYQLFSLSCYLTFPFLISFISPPTSWPVRQINVQTRQQGPNNNRLMCRRLWFAAPAGRGGARSPVSHLERFRGTDASEVRARLTLLRAVERIESQNCCLSVLHKIARVPQTSCRESIYESLIDWFEWE